MLVNRVHKNVTRLRAARSGIRIPVGTKDVFSSPKPSRTALEPAKPPIHWISELLKAVNRPVLLLTRLHTASRLRMSGSIPLRPCISLGGGQGQLYLKPLRVIISNSETPFHVDIYDCCQFQRTCAFLATDLNSNDSYGTVVNLGMEQDGSSPHSAGSRAPHFTLHGGPATPPYLSSSHSPTPPHPALGPNFPYSTGEGLAVYTTLGKCHISL